MLKPKRNKRNITGTAIQRVRLNAHPKITQEDMVGRLARLGITFQQSVISEIESGDRWIKDFELAAIARALRVPITAFFETPRKEQPSGKTPRNRR